MWSTQASRGFSHRQQSIGPVLGAGSSNSKTGDERLQRQPRASKAVQQNSCQENGAPLLQPATAQQPTQTQTQPADRLKQIAARARSEKLRAAAQQLKAGGEGTALGSSPAGSACGRALQQGLGQAGLISPAGSSCGQSLQQGQAAASKAAPTPVAWRPSKLASNVDALLDDDELLGDGEGLTAPWTLRTGVASVDCSPLSMSKAQPAASNTLARRVLLEARVEAAADKAELPVKEEALGTTERAGLFPAAAAPAHSPLHGSRPPSPISSGSVDTAPYIPPPQPPVDVQAAAAAMQRRLERLQRSFSSIGSSTSGGRAAEVTYSSQHSPGESATSRLSRPAMSPDVAGDGAKRPEWALQSAPAVITHALRASEATAGPSQPIRYLQPARPGEMTAQQASEAEARPGSPLRYASRRLEYSQPAWSAQLASDRQGFSSQQQSHLQQPPWQPPLHPLSQPPLQPSLPGRPLSCQAGRVVPQVSGNANAMRLPPSTAAFLTDKSQAPAAACPSAASTDILEAWRASRYSRYLSLDGVTTEATARPMSSLHAAQQQESAKPPLLASGAGETVLYSSSPQQLTAHCASHVSQAGPHTAGYAPGAIGMALPPSVALDRYSKYLNLPGQPPRERPVSTPPISGGYLLSSGSEQQPTLMQPAAARAGAAVGAAGAGSAAATSLLLRACSVEPAIQSSVPAPSEEPAPAANAAAALESGDILERWRARRQQLQRPGVGSTGASSGYNYASLLLLLPPSAVQQQGAALNALAGQSCNSSGIAKGREALYLPEMAAAAGSGDFSSRGSSAVEGRPTGVAQQPPSSTMEVALALPAPASLNAAADEPFEQQRSIRLPVASGNDQETLALPPADNGKLPAATSLASRCEAGTAVDWCCTAEKPAGSGSVCLQPGPGVPAGSDLQADAPACTAWTRSEAADVAAGSRPSSRCSSTLWRSQSTLSQLLDDVVGELF